MKARPVVLENIVSHIDCAAVPEFIIRLVNVEAEYEGKGTLQWLVDCNFVRIMVSRYARLIVFFLTLLDFHLSTSDYNRI
jgi:hypothetical protein